jgi:predicted permease
MEEQLDKELLFHLEQHAADLIAAGHAPEEARRRARVALGGVEQVKEECRDARGTRWLEDLGQDLRYAWRTIWHRPGFTAIVLGTLALGGGATTIVFTLVNSVLLKPLPYPESDRLLTIAEQTDWSTAYGNRWAFAYPNYLDCRSETTAVRLGAWRFMGGTVSVAGEPEYVNGRQVSWDLLATLGASPVHGRSFLESEDRVGAAPVALISHSLWQRHFGGRGSAVGESLVFDGKPYTVVGVTAPDLALSRDADIFTLIGQNPEPRMQNRGAHPGIQVWGRLRPGATLAAAQAELDLLGRRLAEQFPASNRGRSFVAEPLRPFVGDVRSTLWLLLGAVAVVLLIACTNIAALLLARAIARDREMSMRAALGAGRGRLIRQCLAESVVLGLCGGALGLAVAVVGVDRVVALWPGTLPRADEVHIDGLVLAFALGLSLLTGIFFGLAPALRVPGRGLEGVLRSAGRTIAVGSRRLHASFVVAEIALAVVLLLCASVLGRTLIRLSSLDPGIDLRNVLVTRVALSPSTLESAPAARAAWDDLLERARQVPGVEAIAMVDTVPMREGNNQLVYRSTPAPPPSDEQSNALTTSVSAEYLRVTGIPLRRGRFFDDHDRAESAPVVVIDEVLAQQAFGERDAIGQPLWIPDLGPGPFEVVGIVGHVRHWGPATDDTAAVRAQIYYPFAQVPDRFVRRWSELMSIAVRTSTPPLTIIDNLRRALRGATRDQVLYEVRTLEQLASRTIEQQRFLLQVFALFAAVAVLMACIGIHGVLAYLTSQRVAEFGVRMALGASASKVMRLVLGQGFAMILVGTTIGMLVAVGASRLLERFVEGVQRLDVATVLLVISLLTAVALLASAIPARRAGRIDAMTALRQE